MKVSVAVPWRGGDPWRERSQRYVAAHLAACGYEPAFLDSGHDPFNRAASRNLAMDLDADVVIFHDADMVAPADAYAQAATAAVTLGRMVVAFRHYRPLGRRSTTAVLEGADPFAETPITTLSDFSVGGIFALTPEAWKTVGGMDERFIDWGCEDFEFAQAAEARLGPLVRIEADAVHLWHPHAAGHPHEQHNAALLEEGRR